MPLAEMYKTNTVSYTESGQDMTGIFTNTFANLLSGDNKIDYSIFLSTGSDWSYLNKGCKGNHFSKYPDWVSGVLAIRQGPETHDIKYVGSAIVSKNVTSKVINFTKKISSSGNDINVGRFMIDAVSGSVGTAGQYNSFDYAGYTGMKYGFNSVMLHATAFYCTSDTAHNQTFISDYTTLTGDNAKRITQSSYQVILTNYNPYLSDNTSISGTFIIGHIMNFFEIDDELIGVLDPVNMPDSANWQSWTAYVDGSSNVYTTIGEFGSNVTVGIAGALPQNDNVKGIFCYNNNGTTQNVYSTLNAVSFNINSHGLRWHVGNTGISTAGDWRTKIRLGVMGSDGVIKHDEWLVGENAIQASDNPNKTTDYDHIPEHGGGGGSGDELHDMLSRGQFYGSGLMSYYVNPPESKVQKALGSWDNISTGKDVIQNLVSYKALCFPSTTFTSGVLHDFTVAGVTLKDEQDNNIQSATVTKMGGVSLPSITITKTFNDFRDYAPYTKLSMYVPLCGWFELPSWCMGRTIGGEMYINPYGGTVKCIVRADGNVVAELGGNAAIDLPFNATAVGMKTAAVLSNIMSTAGATARAIMLPSPNTISGVGSAALGLICALNANYTESKGVMGDSTNVTGLYSVYIKISRPSTIDSSGNDIKTIPDAYKHENGLPCGKELELQSGDGYTQIMDAKITGNMTAAEKQMIIDGFKHGLNL